MSQKPQKHVGLTNREIALKAEHALRGRDFVTQKGNCLRFAREVVTACRLGAWPLEIGPNAHQACLRLRRLGFEVPKSRGTIPGDLLFKLGTRHNPAGHVGIRIYGNKVAENSTVHARFDSDARGTRTLAEYGEFDVIIRLGKPPER